ncbi:MAG TPA: PqqD family peptide modification chaperone [Methanobacterium sp.]|jgi:hypothetical protein|nr:MAG: PqqD family protein [Methanobacterium sp.]HOI39806.1 PqqD family peptide modification chaperone [Methanobacterium sp.]HOI70949.1 PqqD family peptide modification chaperone [Methanobacterium sp.]HPX78350.1 PqqD family peptide modification chaperone [Methanobacterium sp.]
MKIELTLDSTVQIDNEVVSCDLVDEAAILNMKDGVYYGLNSVGARIWNLIQKPMKVSDILDTLLDEYDVEKDVCMTDLMELLGQLLEKELVKVE